MAGPPAVLNFSTVAVSFAVGFWIRSRSSSPLQTPYTMTVTISGNDHKLQSLLLGTGSAASNEVLIHLTLCCAEFAFFTVMWNDNHPAL